MTWNDINLLALRILTRWWIVVIIAGLVVGVSAWRVMDTPPSYSATVMLVVSPNLDLDQNDALRVADMLNRDSIMSTYVDVMSSQRVVGSAMVSAGDSTTGALLWPGYDVRVTREPGSNVLRLTAEGPEKEATETLAEHTRLIGEATMAELYPMISMTALTTGTPTAEPSSLSLTRVLGIAVFIGVGFGLLVALWFDSLLDYRARSAALSAPAPARPPTTVEIGPAGQQVVTSRRT